MPPKSISSRTPSTQKHTRKSVSGPPWMNIPVTRLIRKLSARTPASRRLTKSETLKLHNVLFNLNLYDSMDLDDSFIHTFNTRFRTHNRFHCGLVVALLSLSIHNPIDPISPFHAHHIDSHTSSQIDSTSQQLGKALLNALSSSTP